MISVKNLKKTYFLGGEEVHALDDVSLSIKEHEFVAIIGQSGSGKSTFMNMLGCLDRPDSGEITLDGTDILKCKEKELSVIRNKKIGFIFQQFHLLPKLSALENVELPLIYQGMPTKKRREKAVKALKAVGLEKRMNHKPNQLSGGQQRRVALAGVLAMDPEVLILDEPAAGLDPKGRDKILGQIKQYHEKYGKTILLVSHSMEDIVKYAGKVLVMNKSRLFCYDTVDRVFARTEELAKIGLDVPQVTRMSHILKSLGTDIGNDIYTTERAAERLLPLIR